MITVQDILHDMHEELKEKIETLSGVEVDDIAINSGKYDADTIEVMYKDHSIELYDEDNVPHEVQKFVKKVDRVAQVEDLVKDVESTLEGCSLLAENNVEFDDLDDVNTIEVTDSYDLNFFTGKYEWVVVVYVNDHCSTFKKKDKRYKDAKTFKELLEKYEVV